MKMAEECAEVLKIMDESIVSEKTPADYKIR